MRKKFGLVKLLGATSALIAFEAVVGFLTDRPATPVHRGAARLRV